jgi:[protein-PII] uridylyltransferase
MIELQPLFFFDEERFRGRLKDSNPLTVFKDAIAAANGHFDSRFLEGEHVDNLIHERSGFIDRILAYAWDQFDWDDNIALLAVGGYGRCELHPYSDIDLLILLKKSNTKPYKENIEKFLTFLWDIQLKIGQSVRSIRQCTQEAKADLTIATNLMESRTLVGNPLLRKEMMAKTAPNKIWASRVFFKAKCEEQVVRHSKHSYTEYNLEPNVKEAPGGLRDIQMITWVALRHFGVNALDQLTLKGFITEGELGILMKGRTFLWKVRYGLHYLAKRPEEKLSFDYQRRLAEMFGYKDKEKLGVEQFMQHYYQVVLSMRELNDVLLQHLEETILQNKAGKIRPINERFQIRDNHIETVNKDLFKTQPSALLEIFVLLGEDPAIEGIRASTIREIQRWRHLINDEFRANPDNKALFMRLFSCEGKLSPQLQRMTRYGVLGRYLPEFGRIVGQTQHDLFHIYPVDVHTLMVIRNLRRFNRPEVAALYPLAAHIYKNLPKPELLYISGLYHDIGKGRGGDHSMLGATDVARFAENHGLSPQEVDLLKWLVEKHLLMSAVSQREDISDPEVIQHFATIVGDQIRLDYLYLLTMADIMSTNPTLLNSWRDSLMRTLYTHTKNALQRGLENPLSRAEWVNNTIDETLSILAQKGIDEAQAKSIWTDVDEEFFLRERASVIARCVEAIHNNPDSALPVIIVEEAGSEGVVATRIFIHTKGQSNVFPVTAAALDQLNLNIQDARLNTCSNGHTFDMFYVLNEKGEPIGNDSDRIKAIIDSLTLVISSPSRQIFDVHRRTPLMLKQFNLKTQTFLRNETGSNLTALEVVTPDRPGLLAHLGKIFMRFGLRLHQARIATLGERVEDVFYITDLDYQPLSDPSFCQQLQTTICNELDERNQEANASTPNKRAMPWQ